MLTIVLAVLAAVANAFASVLQRKGALEAPPGHGNPVQVLVDQLHHKVWFGGIGLMVVAFLLQAAALSGGNLALVQPTLAGELPVTLLVASRMFKRPLARREWLAVVAMTVGLAVALGAASPTAGVPESTNSAWVIGCGGAMVLVVASAVGGWRTHGVARAALYGITTGALFGLTATFITTVTARAQDGIGPLLSAWQLYAMFAAGAGAVAFMQLAYAAGVLTAAQPGVTLVDPVVAVALAIYLFHAKIAMGGALIFEILGATLVIAGALELCRSPLTAGGKDGSAGPSGGSDDSGSRRRTEHGGTSAVAPLP